jgi:hypothetical protein
MRLAPARWLAHSAHPEVRRMRWTMARRDGLIALGALALVGRVAAAPHGAGRWEGQALVQGQALPLVVDLAPDAGGAWVGSITLPGRRVKGAPLAALQVDARGARFTLAAAFLAPTEPAPEMVLRWRGGARADGELRIDGLVAPVSLHRSGDAQVDPAPRSTPIDDALLGTWSGRYQLGGAEREVTLTLARDDAGRAQASMVIVGRRRTELAFDLVQQGPRFLTLRGNPFGIVVEGAWSAQIIEATLEQGPFEAALPLRRVAEAKK